MENKQNENLWIVLGVVLVVVAGLMFWVINKPESVVVSSQNDNNVESVTDSTEDVTDGSINTTIPGAAISYANALVKYKDARLQLDKKCQASPDKMTFKNGQNIMIDNRAPVSRTVKVGTTFSIKGYGFKIVKLSSLSLPATWYVDCDSSQNVSTILIQK